MRIGEVIGTVTCSQLHPSLVGASFKLVIPLTWENLTGEGEKPAEVFAVFDELGAGIGHQVVVSEGREAAMPFYPEVKPIDAYNAAILDEVRVEKAP